MHTLGRWLRLPRQRQLERALVLAGGAAGIAAAFNTPLAGVVFAIEELSRSFEERTTGTVFTAVIVAGIELDGGAGQLHLFRPHQRGPRFGRGWGPVLVCGVVGGLSGRLVRAAPDHASPAACPAVAAAAG